MPNPSYTGTPLWLLTPTLWGTTNTTSGFLPNFGGNGPVGPFKSGTDSWWVAYTTNPSGVNVLSTIAAWKGTSTNSWPQVLSTFSGNHLTASMQQYWDGTSSNVWFTWASGTGGNPIPLLVANFDIVAGTFGTANDPSVGIHNSGIAFVNNLNNGNLVLTWDDTGGTGTKGVWSQVYSSGTWGSKISISTDTGTTGHPILVTLTPIASNCLGIMLQTEGNGVAPDSLIYKVFDGTATSNVLTSTLTATNAIFTFPPWLGVYDSGRDMVVFSLPETKDTSHGYILNQSIWTISPSRTGTAINRTVIDSDPFTGTLGTTTNPWYLYGWQQTYFGKQPDSGTFYQMVDYTFPILGNPKLYIYSATAGTGSWGGSSTFYDQLAHEPSPVAYPYAGTASTALIYNYYFNVLSDNKIYTTIEMAGEPGNSGRYSLVAAGPSSQGCPTIVSACPTTNTLMIGTTYTSTLTAIGGTAPYNWTVIS